MGGRVMKTVLVTGANRGIGKAIAQGMHDLGYRVVIGARNLEAGKEAANQIGCEAIELDLEPVSYTHLTLPTTSRV